MPQHLEQQPIRTDGKAVAALVLGLVSFCATVFTGIPAIVYGFLSLGAIRKSGGRLQGKGMAIAGIVLGFVGQLFVIPLVLLIYFLNSLPGYFDNVKIDAAKVKISVIENECRDYKLRTGNFPADLQELARPMNGRPADLEPDFLIDPWGNPFHYEPQDLNSSGQPHIYSGGPDGNTIIDNWNTK